MEVVATSISSGTATLENKSNDQKVTHTFNSDHTDGDLCLTDADWIVEASQSGGAQVTLDDFGTVKFTNTAAITSSGSLSVANGETIIIINQSGGTVAST